MIDSTPFRFLYSCLGLFVGSGFMLAGLLLFLRQITTPRRSWAIKIGPFTISNAAPGLGFAFLGALVIWFTRFM